MNAEEMTKEIRCKKCNRLLMKAKKVHAEIQCPKCGYKNLVLTHTLGVLNYDGDKFGTIPEVGKIKV